MMVGPEFERVRELFMEGEGHLLPMSPNQQSIGERQSNGGKAVWISLIN